MLRSCPVKLVLEKYAAKIAVPIPKHVRVGASVVLNQLPHGAKVTIVLNFPAPPRYKVGRSADIYCFSARCGHNIVFGGVGGSLEMQTRVIFAPS